MTDFQPLAPGFGLAVNTCRPAPAPEPSEAPEPTTMSESKYDDLAQEILDHIANADGELSSSNLNDLIDVEPAQKKAAIILLQKQGKIVIEGRARATTYRLSDAPPQPPRKAATQKTKAAPAKAPPTPPAAAPADPVLEALTQTARGAEEALQAYIRRCTDPYTLDALIANRDRAQEVLAVYREA